MATGGMATHGDEVSGLLHECGVFGCVATGDWPTQLDVAHIICLGLTGIQHRGQESSGMTTCSGDAPPYRFISEKRKGLVSEVFSEETLAKLQGNLGIGHNRYSTSGGSDPMNYQPFVREIMSPVRGKPGQIAIAHNGELVNSASLRQELLEKGADLVSSSDSELILKLLCFPSKDKQDNGPDWIKSRIKHVMERSRTAYALLIMHEDTIYAVRDPHGNRPLCIGKIPASRDVPRCTGSSSDCCLDTDGWVVSSESCSFPSIGAKFYREVKPGEIVQISKTGVADSEDWRVDLPSGITTAFCIFEYVYFARADTEFEGQTVYSVRFECGRQLAIEAGLEADIISTVPESATPAALGFSQQSQIPYMEVLCKNRYVGRTFIQPTNRLRRLGVSKKFGAITSNIEGKRIVLLDDSIVRGNTMGPIIALLRQANAKEVHVRIASPPLQYPCYMGINIPTREELIANHMNLSQLAEHLGADSVQYLSEEGLAASVQKGIKGFKFDPSKHGHCMACLTGKYPVDW